MKKEEKTSRSIWWLFRKKGAKARLYPLIDRTVAISMEDNNWAETHYGRLKDDWKDVDPIKQLKEMREEWDEEE